MIPLIPVGPNVAVTVPSEADVFDEFTYGESDEQLTGAMLAALRGSSAKPLLPIYFGAGSAGVTIPKPHLVRLATVYGMNDGLIGTMYDILTPNPDIELSMTYDFFELSKNDWQWTEGVVSAAFVYGPDRNTSGLPTAPSTGVRIRFGNASHGGESAENTRYQPVSRLLTCWANTLREDPTDELTTRIIPLPGDYFTYNSTNYVITSVKTVEYDTQYVCECAVQPTRNLNTTLGY